MRRLLDLFCGAGGCSVGYARAGFEVVGVDINPQPRYPFEFHQGDAMTCPLDGFDVIHASPPCQDHSPLKSRAGLHDTGWMLDEISERLRASGLVYVIENVAGAKMPTSLMLCGGMFGLRVYRHRRFEIALEVGLLNVPPHPPHKVRTSTKNRRRDWEAGMNISVTGDIGSTIGRLAMGIPWMNSNELSQAIPPAYTEFIGGQLMDALAVA